MESKTIVMLESELDHIKSVANRAGRISMLITIIGQAAELKRHMSMVSTEWLMELLEEQLKKEK